MPETAYRGNPEVISASRRHNALVRHRGRDNPVTQDAARDLRAASLLEHAQRVADAAPPITAEQKAAVIAVLNSAHTEVLDASGLFNAGEQ